MLITIPDWVKDAIFYQIFPDRFARSERLPPQPHFEPWDSPPTTLGFKGGDLFGVLERLDYLQDLGITAIYFTPIFSSAANHRYHTYDYFTVDPLLGGNAALRELLDAAHARGMRVVLDGVFNHASRGLWQFHHVLENGATSPYVDWFHFNHDHLTGKRHFAAYPDPEARSALRRGVGSYEALGYEAWWNLPALPKFNTATPAVREFLWNVASHWMTFGIDGWRLDVPEEIKDATFWQEFRRRVKAINSEAYIVGEIWHPAQEWLHGDRFDAVMNYPFAAGCLGFCGSDQLNLSEARHPGGLRHVRPLSESEFADHIDWLVSLYDPEVTSVQLNLLDSHDTARFLTSVNGDKTALQLAVLLLLTLPGAPCVYYGDEVGVDGKHDPDCRKAFPWDTTVWDHSLYTFVKKCIALRHSHPALRRGEYRRLYAKDGVYAFARKLGDEVVVVALNAAREARRVDIPGYLVGLQDGRSLRDVWSPRTWTVHKGIVPSVELAPRSGVVLA
ncbi:MAG: glycoside hydrolase family 13 protein [Candidatus Binatia bacterium]